MPKKPTNKMASAMPSEARHYRDIDLHTLASLLNADATRRPASDAPGVPRKPPGPVARNVIAFLAANPDGTHALKLGDECAEIQRELQRAPFRHDFLFESRWAITIHELVRQLNELDPQIIHFGGHGSADGLLLQDEQGKPVLVSPRALAMLVKGTARNARVVMLNACWTTTHADALCAHVDVVVAMGGAIDDGAARVFATRFYGALGNRRSIGNAVEQGIATLAAMGLPDEVLPRCVTRDGLDADEVVLTCDPP